MERKKKRIKISVRRASSMSSKTTVSAFFELVASLPIFGSDNLASLLAGASSSSSLLSDIKDSNSERLWKGKNVRKCQRKKANWKRMKKRERERERQNGEIQCK